MRVWLLVAGAILWWSGAGVAAGQSAARAARRGPAIATTPPAAAPPAPTTPADSSASKRPAPAIPFGENLPKELANAVVIIEGDEGRGSGFVVRMRGQLFVVTNLHVLSGNAKFTVTGVDGTVYPTTGQMLGAKNYDIAMLKIPEAKYALEMVPDANDGPEAEDFVTVPGNSQGAGVATQTHGRLLGVGPQLVEVDARFVQGNSGSPIIHRPTGKVLGVATFAVTYRLDDLKRAANIRSVRWFGYRLDNVKDWELLDWKKFSKEGQEVRAMEKMTDDLIAVLVSKSDPEGNDDLRQAFEIFRRSASEAVRRNNEQEYLRALSRLTSHLRFAAEKDIKNLNSQPLYSYHAEKVRDQQEVRAKISRAFDDLGASLRAAQR